MPRHTFSPLRQVLVGAALALITFAPAFGEPPLPRPKPAIVIERVVEAAPAPVPGPLPEVNPDESAMDAASIVWSVYRLTWLLAVIGLGVIALSIWQVFAARDATRRQLRAYVSVRAGAAPHLDADWTDASVIVTNHGQTPAFAVDHAVTLMMLDYPDMPLDNVIGAADKMFGKKALVLAPGAELTLPLRTVLSEDEKHETEDGTHKRLVAVGEIRYADAFKKRHFTRFCFMYGGAAIISGGQMQIADKGNEAD